MAEFSQSAVTIFVPLVFTVVMQLSAVTRRLDDDVARADRPPLFFPRGHRLVPGLGRLNVVHATNVALLSGCLVLVQAARDPVATVLSLLVVFVWVQLPLLEVEEYATLCEDAYPTSLYFHVAATLVLAGYATVAIDSAAVVADLDLLSLDPATLGRARAVPPLLGLGALWLSGVFGFLHLLQWDLTARDLEGEARRWVERHLPAFPDRGDSGVG